MSLLAMPMPNRRESETFRLPVGEPGKEKTYWVTLGFTWIQNRKVVGECFIKHGKEGQELDNLAADVGIIVSKLLQMGLPVGELLEDMTRLPSFSISDATPGASEDNDIQPASILGGVLKLISDEQQRLDEEFS